MPKPRCQLNVEALDRAELEEHILVLRLLISATYARETGLENKVWLSDDLRTLITRYTGCRPTPPRRAVDPEFDALDDEGPQDPDRQRSVQAYCRPALRAAERAWRRNDCPDALDALCEELTQALRLTPTQCALFRLVLACQRNTDLRELCKQLGRLDEDRIIQLCEELLGCTSEDLHEAFDSGSPLLGNEADGHGTVMQWLCLPRAAEQRLRTKLRRGERLEARDFLDGLFQRAPAARLQLDDFPDPTGEIALLQRYLARLVQTPRPGVNILLYGPPGTGKTQLVRALCQHLGMSLFEVPTEDEDQDPLGAAQRLAGFRAAQAHAELMRPAAVHFDEFEDVFPAERDDAPFRLFGWRRSARTQPKGWINQLLESHPVPALWVGNRIDGLDAAYLRRFDMILEVKQPRPEARARMVHAFFQKPPLPDETEQLLAADARLSPAHLERVASVLRTLDPPDAAATAHAVRILRGQIVRTLREREPTPAAHSPLRYRPECTTADAPLDAVLEGLARTGSGRLCLYGPPGTGKTAWVHHVGARLGKTVLLKRASDLLGSLVGQTEQAIRAAFDEAEREQAILLIDEADSFLRDRQLAHVSWEITQVNEWLTCMERHEGIVFAATNLFADLDAASLRRFDFKIRFGYLQAAQSQKLLRESLHALGQPPELDADTLHRLDRLDRLTPGDFAAVLRRLRIHAGARTAAAFVQALADEIALRQRTEPRKVGFV